ncbi:MAG: hypothetical protein PF485_07725 [Bacteroidales bacterium]|jgi:hypothetical protein|nr:hypothetical protein [Bacteroidales bacterium]
MKKIIFLLSIILLVAGCASKRYTKKASKFEEAGLYEDAAEYYYQAVKKKDSNVDAKLGLRKNGQLTLDRKLSDFTFAYKQSDYKKAVYNYLEAEKYNNKIKTVNVDLDFPEYHKEYYEEAKSDYLNKKYSDGLDKLNREDFTAALIVFEEIKGIDFNYKDVKELYVTAKYEPMYRNANQYLETELFRKAYYTFETIIIGAGSYKQSVALKDESQEKGTITILVTDFSYSNRRFGETANAITSNLKAELSRLDNTFIKIIDAASLNSNMYENGQINIQAANLAGIKAVLTGSVTKVSTTTGGLTKKQKKGYLKEVTKTKDKEGKIIKKVKYYKTRYWEYKQVNRASLALNFKLVSTNDNVVMVSDMINTSDSDKIHYATFSGDKKKLIPGNWKYKDRNSKEDIKKDNKSDINRLNRLLKADKSIKSAESLLNEIMNQSVNKIAKKIDKYNPEN